MYISEAHSVDEWYLSSTEVAIKQHTTLKERLDTARSFAERHPSQFPLVVDAMDDNFDLAYAVKPEALLVFQTGRLGFRTKRGPMGYRPEELEAFLEGLFPHTPEPSKADLNAAGLLKVAPGTPLSGVGVHFDAAKADELLDATVMAEVVREIAGSHVVVYSKTYCQFCKRVKVLLAEAMKRVKTARDAESGGKRHAAIDVCVVELDKTEQGVAYQAALYKRTGRATVPQVFIGGSIVGGCDDVEAAAKSGRLDALLRAE